MSNLTARVLTAAVALPVLVLLVLWKVRWGFGALVIAAAAGGLWEDTGMLLAELGRGRRLAVVAAGTALAVALYARPELAYVWLLAALVVGATAVLLGPG